ncbi:MAG: hypothetical protein RLZZ528_104 [Pseudomonadota bacterium]
MKKVLLATSALMLVAGAAAAEVAVSGSARMGVVYNGTDAEFSSRVRVSFSMSGETDGGLAFGASVRADQSGQGGTANGDSTVYISGAFGKLTMGDVGGAADALVGQVSGVGYTGLGDVNEIGFLGTDKTAVYYEYTTGAVTFGVGAGQTTGANENINVGVKYAGSNFTVALGYEDSATDSQISAKGTMTFGSATVKAKVADRDSAADMASALSVDFAAGGATITAFVSQNQNFAGNDGAGIGASYDLGGGATLSGGIVDNGTDTVADLGVSFSF